MLPLLLKGLLPRMVGGRNRFVPCRRVLRGGAAWVTLGGLCGSSAGLAKVEMRECAGKYCTVRFVPNHPEQRFCGRGCSFKALKYSRYKELWRGISESRDYNNRWDRDDD